ncbi:transport permease protein [Paractinoplanes abujensis]|uniref:Transport permease protein n=1 Tax=Paractinoplanes abujensis TaxID=882441 RepID=A0A7W7CTZ8_9ACTN|nr:ABC transporter permease [Actinoplanes abujensis]MBB4694648.1 lipooligosaccharide transport system permease protein [Actinoplanes abujensis]GID20138.1 transport permease protein [Actinoplanes abujensis]
MVSLVMPRLLSFEGTGRRAASVTERNISTLRSAYWVVMVSGFLEPVLYLFSIGVGVGALIGDITLPGGEVVGYAEFVAPAMLAASAMTGALAETTFNFFGKMKFVRLYEGILATPVRPIEIALGELAWAMVRGVIYSAAFVVIMTLMGLTTWSRALVMLPATLLVGLAFGALGMAVATIIRSWQDFDLIAAGQFALFLFSGTFVPPTAYPAVVRWLIEATPLYRSVDLIRALSTGTTGWLQLLDVLYLCALMVLGLTVAGRRMEKQLCK